MKSIVYLINSNGMGSTNDPSLREKLIGTFFKLQLETDNPPAAICFYTDGVRLACEGSPILQELEALEKQGTRLVLCQTCLNQFNLLDCVKVGIVGGMGDILTAMQQADSVVTL